MSIWFKPYVLADIAWMKQNTIHESLGIEIIEIGNNFIKGTMPVDHRTKQPAGILHGGASVVLAESLGSIASTLVVNPEHFYCVGLDINANHLRGAASGIVQGIAMPIHIGRTTHVWSIEITNAEKKPVCISRLTMAILKKAQ